MLATLLIEQELLTGSTTGSASASGYTMTSAQNLEICALADLRAPAAQPPRTAGARASYAWRRSGSAVTPRKKPRSWTRSPRSVWCTRTCP